MWESVRSFNEPHYIPYCVRSVSSPRKGFCVIHATGTQSPELIRSVYRKARDPNFLTKDNENFVSVLSFT